jgi:hypothetical protein
MTDMMRASPHIDASYVLFMGLSEAEELWRKQKAAVRL